MRPRCVWISLVLVSVAFAGCRDKPQDGTKSVSATAAERYRVRGKIVGMSPDEIDLQHERIAAIRGFDGTIKPMESMTMPFGRDQTSLAGLSVGDVVEIQFTVHFDSDPTLRLVEITKLPTSTKLELP